MRQRVDRKRDTRSQTLLSVFKPRMKPARIRRQHVLIRKEFPEQPYRMTTYEIKKKECHPSAVNVRKYHGAMGNLPHQRRRRQQLRQQYGRPPGVSVGYPPPQPRVHMYHLPMYPGQTPDIHLC